MKDGPDELKKRVERQARRMQKAERERPTLIGQTMYIGNVVLLFLLPVVGGAYLGDWLDSQEAGYSVHWTISLILVGIGIGVLNVYLFIKD